MLSDLHDAHKTRASFKVSFRKDPSKTPYLQFKCPKQGCGCGTVEIQKIADQFQEFAQQAADTGYEKYQHEFTQIAGQIGSCQMQAMHLLCPQRITMCPGHCVGSSGMVVPPSVRERRSRCGNNDCHRCGYVYRETPVKVMTCPHGCMSEKTARPMRWCIECGGDHAEHERCDHRARWKRLDAQTRDMLEGMVKTGDARHCPNCYLVVTKGGGCDKLRCPECGTKFCLKCGDRLDEDYVYNHLFAVRGGQRADDLVCRKTAVEKAFSGEKPFLEEVISAYQSGSRLIVEDVDKMARVLGVEKIPEALVQILPPRLFGAAVARRQLDMDALLAAQMMAEMPDDAW